MSFLGDLVARARKGDRQAFDEIVRRTYLDTLALARRLSGNDEDARDIVQEAYLRAYRGLKNFRGDSRFTTWLYRITANCAATYRNRRQKHRHTALDEVAFTLRDGCPERDPVLRTDASLLRRDLDAALRRLPERLRAVLVLRDVHDLAHDEIARELGITEGAAKVRLHRARRRLLELIGHEPRPAPAPAAERAEAPGAAAAAAADAGEPAEEPGTEATAGEAAAEDVGVAHGV